MQELSGTIPTANLLTGGLDEYFTRTDSVGVANFVTDALGSTVALADMTGTIQTQYSFDPFGSIAQSGTSSTNSFLYTGREGDGTGLYYFRARYYSPQFGRFISEDPAGYLGGGNLYAYALANPLTYRDPEGKFVPLITGAIGAIAGGGGDIAAQILANSIAGRPLTNINWKEAGVATVVGGAAGAAAPFVATTYVGASLLGGLANLTQTVLGNAIQHKCTTTGQALLSLGSGLAGGLLGGPVSAPSVYNAAGDPLRNLLGLPGRIDSEVANALNQQAAAGWMFGAGNLTRSGSAALISNGATQDYNLP